MLLNVVLVGGVGLFLFFVIANIVDTIIYRIATGTRDPLQYMARVFLTGPNPRQALILNIVRPVILTLVIFGGGMFAVAFLSFQTLGTVLSGIWFFFLTQYACLIGRKTSLYEAGWAMVITVGIIILVYVVVV